MFVDSHCHLTFPELASRLAHVREAMRRERVGAALCVCTSLEEFPSVAALVAHEENLWASVGVHPDTVHMTEPDVAALCERATTAKVVAIGETGLDYYRLDGRSHDDMEWQRERFRIHIRASRVSRLPLIVHTRSAADDTLTIMREEHASSAGGVMHCFTETLDVAKAALDMGFYISFSGILTFRNAEALRDVARFVPLDRCLVETDSPYLSPVPFRGKVNEPAWVRFVAEQLALVKGRSVGEIAAATTANFERLFSVHVGTDRL